MATTSSTSSHITSLDLKSMTKIKEKFDWINVVHDKYYDVQLENSVIYLMTNHDLGSGGKSVMWFSDKDLNPAGGLSLRFTEEKSHVDYNLHACNPYRKLPTQPPEGKHKVWKIKKRGFGMELWCNEVFLLDFVISGETCDDPDWDTVHSRKGVALRFPEEHDTATKLFYSGYCFNLVIRDNSI